MYRQFYDLAISIGGNNRLWANEIRNMLNQKAGKYIKQSERKLLKWNIRYVQNIDDFIYDNHERMGHIVIEGMRDFWSYQRRKSKKKGLSTNYLADQELNASILGELIYAQLMTVKFANLKVYDDKNFLEDEEYKYRHQFIIYSLFKSEFRDTLNAYYVKLNKQYINISKNVSQQLRIKDNALEIKKIPGLCDDILNEILKLSIELYKPV